MAVPAPDTHAAAESRQDSRKHDVQGTVRKDSMPVHTDLNRRKKQMHDFMNSFFTQHTLAHTPSLILSCLNNTTQKGRS